MADERDFREDVNTELRQGFESLGFKTSVPDDCSEIKLRMEAAGIAANICKNEFHSFGYNDGVTKERMFFIADSIMAYVKQTN